MAFIRIKKISSNKYAYLVESTNTNKGPRQKVKQYLGRVHELEKNDETNVESNYNPNTKKEILSSLILPELSSRGFSKNKDKFQHKSLLFCPRELSITKKNGKEAILAVEEGYLCSYTLQRLLNFKKSKDLNSDALKLAKYFLEAGLAISEEKFVKFYQKSN